MREFLIFHFISIEAAREEYKKLLEEGGKKTSIFNSYF